MTYRRRLVLSSAYIDWVIPMDENNTCITDTRDGGIKYQSVNDIVNKFSNIPVVKCYGIISVEVFDTEERTSKKVPTIWDIRK